MVSGGTAMGYLVTFSVSRSDEAMNPNLLSTIYAVTAAATVKRPEIFRIRPELARRCSNLLDDQICSEPAVEERDHVGVCERTRCWTKLYVVRRRV
jgi:hypothetical protein